ncbi:hypothetical protein C8J56DRAFT_325130 [Mycena floridula]|nr:hypothetical protein C8J56DRAFT_325130 [Mycena floridula]
MFRSHLTIVETSASLYSSASAFKIPVVDPETGKPKDWHSISYRQFLLDVEHSAKYWYRTLGHLPPKSVVGLWIGGFTYIDLLHIYGISRAGLIPQLVSLRLPNPVVVFELLLKANAKALIHDPSFQSIISDSPVPTHPAVSILDVALDIPVPDMPQLTLDDTAFFFHTSGSTSGSPKVIPYSYRWLDFSITKSRTIMTPRNPERQDVTTWMASVCHVAQSTILLGSLQHGTCTVQPTNTMTYDSAEFVEMVVKLKLNRLNQFPSFLSHRLTEAKQDPKLLSILTQLDQVLYTGMPLPAAIQDFAYKSGIPLKCIFGSTECGATLLSLGGSGKDAQLLKPFDGTSYAFIPAHSTEQDHQSTTRLLEFVVLAGSPDCPDVSLRATDGHFHTGDLFSETTPGSGLYISRGRNDDWIKTENSLRCDTKSIEDNVRAMCGDLIAECVVVGSGRPSPALFVECALEMDSEKLKKEIIRKTRQFHSRRYLHERITSKDMIIVVERGTLPRTATKGNVRRQAVEEAYRSQLDQVYGLRL